MQQRWSRLKAELKVISAMKFQSKKRDFLRKAFVSWLSINSFQAPSVCHSNSNLKDLISEFFNFYKQRKHSK